MGENVQRRDKLSRYRCFFHRRFKRKTIKIAKICLKALYWKYFRSWKLTNNLLQDRRNCNDAADHVLSLLTSLWATLKFILIESNILKRKSFYYFRYN